MCAQLGALPAHLLLGLTQGLGLAGVSLEFSTWLDLWLLGFALCEGTVKGRERPVRRGRIALLCAHPGIFTGGKTTCDKCFQFAGVWIFSYFILSGDVRFHVNII